MRGGGRRGEERGRGGGVEGRGNDEHFSQKWGVNSKSYNFFELSEQANIQLSIKMLSPWPLPPPSYPPIRPPPSYAIRPNVHQFNTPQIKFDKLKNSFIHRNFT